MGRKKKAMSDYHVSLLGQMRDADLAKITGLSLSTISKRRKEFSIPSYRGGRSTPECESVSFARREMFKKYPGMFEMLGNKTDTHVACVFGLSRQRIHQYRTSLSISKCTGGVLNKLPEDDVRYLLNNAGHVSDSELSRQLGISLYNIRKVRLQYGIPNKRNQKSASNKALLDMVVSRLGVESDHLIGRDLNIPSSVVRAYRIRLGIDSRVVSRWRPVEEGIVIKLFNEGLSDSDIAKRLGCSIVTVGTKRRRAGLYRPLGRPTTATG